MAACRTNPARSYMARAPAVFDDRRVEQCPTGAQPAKVLVHAHLGQLVDALPLVDQRTGAHHLACVQGEEDGAAGRDDQTLGVVE